MTYGVPLIVTVWSTAFLPGTERAKRSLTIATPAPDSSSPGRKSRPTDIRTPRSRKKPAVTCAPRSLGRREDRSGRAQPEADRQNDGRREHRSSPHATQRDSEILQQRIHYSFLSAIIGSMRVARRA